MMVEFGTGLWIRHPAERNYSRRSRVMVGYLTHGVNQPSSRQHSSPADLACTCTLKCTWYLLLLHLYLHLPAQRKAVLTMTRLLKPEGLKGARRQPKGLIYYPVKVTLLHTWCLKGYLVKGLLTLCWEHGFTSVVFSSPVNRKELSAATEQWDFPRQSVV